MRSWCARVSVSTMFAVFGFHSSASASLIGQDITASWQAYDGINSSPVFTRTDTVIDPGAEIAYGDAQSAQWNWMKPGDQIDVAPYPNPSAPWQYNLVFGPGHVFTFGTFLWLKFELPPELQYGNKTAIVALDNIQQVQITKPTAHTMEILIGDMWRVSQGDYGGGMTVHFNIVAVPEPATGLSALGLCGVFALRRRGR